VLTGGVSGAVTVGGDGGGDCVRAFGPSTPLLGSGAADFIPLTAGDCAELVTGCVIAGGAFW